MEEQRRKRVMAYFTTLLQGKEVPAQVIETKQIGIIRLNLN